MKALLVLFLATPMLAQVVDGTVVDAITGMPLSGAYVNCSPIATGEQAAVRTGESGYFQCPETRSPVLAIEVARTGYFNASRMSSLTSVSANIGPQGRIELTPVAVIAGTILDEDGFPAREAFVQALWCDKATLLSPPSNADSTFTDDLGRYRLVLPAGRYAIRVRAGRLSHWDRRYSTPLFFPGTPNFDSANIIDLKQGEIRDGLDLRFTKQEGVTVAGRVVVPEVTPNGSLSVELRFPGGEFTAFTGLAEDRTFLFRHVPPGNYTLRVSAGTQPPPAGSPFAEQSIQVGTADLTNITVTPAEAKPIDLSGAIVTADGTAVPALIVAVRTNTGRSLTARPSDDGAFTVRGLLPGHYAIQLLPANVTGLVDLIKFPGALSVTLGERDIQRDGFDLNGPDPGPLRITLGTPTELTGKLLDAKGQPLAGAMLLFVPRGGQPRGPAITGPDGRFQTYLLAPATYRIYAARDRTTTALLLNPAYQKQHESDFPAIEAVPGTPLAPTTLTLPAQVH